MKLKDRIKTMSFWMGLIGAVFLILGAFGVEIGDETASSIINAVCSILVVFGVVAAPQKDESESDEITSATTKPEADNDEKNSNN